MFVTVCSYYITFIVPVDSHGHGMSVGEPIHTFVLQFKPIFICKRKFPRNFHYVILSTNNLKYIIVYINRSMNENVRNDVSFKK